MKKIAFITGSSRGIGRAVAVRLAEEGYAVAGNCLQSIGLAEELAGSLRRQGYAAAALQADVADRAAITAAIRRAEEALGGPISLLVNNAGVAEQHLFQDVSDTFWRRIFAVNVDGAFHTIQAVLPAMLHEKEGCIINISSIASFVPNARMSVYSASKAYVSFFSRGLYEELRPRKIAVTAVCPGPMETEFLSVGRITGNSKTFDRLPYCDPKKVVKGALAASKARRAVYTPRGFYKFYRVLSGLVPHAILVHAAKT